MKKTNFFFILKIIFFINLTLIISLQLKSFASLDAIPSADLMRDSTPDLIDSPLDCKIDENSPCIFGNSRNRFNEDIRDKTCMDKNQFYDKNQNKNRYYCMPPNFWGQTGESKGVLIECSLGGRSSHLNYTDIIVKGDIDNNTYVHIEGKKVVYPFRQYKLTRVDDFRSHIQSNCSYCGNNGIGGLSSCPDWNKTVAVGSDCEVTQVDACTFGGAGGKNNCYTANKFEEVAGAKYLCAGNSQATGNNQGVTFKCTKNIGSITSYSQIFDVTNVNGINYYALKPSAQADFGCSIGTTTITRQNDCRIANNSVDCTFGSVSTGSGRTNCAEVGSSGIISYNSVHHYCTPRTNKVVYCRDKLDYSSIFENNTVNGVTTFSSSIKDQYKNSCKEGWAPLDPTVDLFSVPNILTLNPTDVPPLSPLGLIRNVSNFLYYFAIFYFIILILTNAFSYVRAGEDPQKLKQIKESLFNTVAGFLFVILSGGVIVYLINQISI